MFKVAIFLTALLGLLNLSAAAPYQNYPDEYYVYTGCETAIAAAALFCPTSKSSSSKRDLSLVNNPNFQQKKKKSTTSPCICSKDWGLASLANCNYNHSSEFNEISDNYIISGCKKLKAKVTRKQIHEAYTKYKGQFVDISKNKTYNVTKGDVTTSPVLAPAKKYRLVYLSTKMRWDNVTYGFRYGIALVAYWAGIFLIAGVYQWTRYLFPGILRVTGTNKLTNSVRRFVTLPPLFRNKHLQPVLFAKIPIGLIPTRLESLVILGYFILHIVFLTVHYTHVEGNTVFTTKQNEISRYVGDRSGVILSFTTPLAFLFAGKNNFLIWLTGIKQSSFIVYHRWSARILTAVMVIHAGAFVSQSQALGKLHSRLQADYFRWGIVAFAFGLALCVHAMYTLRSKYYEAFLLFHLLFGFFFIFGAWRHAASQGYAEWYYAAAAAWIFDRVVSGFRVLAFGFPKATVQLIANETLKVTVPKPKYWKSYPGAYAYVYFFTPMSFWQSHSFTILDSAVNSNELSFHIKVKHGITASLANKLRNLPNNNQKLQIRLSVEGPYGVSTPMKKYNKAVLFASGNGIPGLYYYATDLARNLSSSETKKQVKLYWVVRYYESLEWLHEELLKLKDLNVQTTIYVTRPNASKDAVLHDNVHYSDKYDEKADGSETNSKENTEGELEKSALSFNVADVVKQLNHITFKEGRPNVDELVASEIETAEQSVAFMSCGHANIIDAMRVSISKRLSSTVRVDYFEENQQW